VLALPILLALLHLALFSFDRRARENLFYALEMLTFAGIVLREYRDVLLTSDAQRELAGQLDRIGRGLPIIAILFSALTYYALRTRPWPKSWRIFLVAGIVLYPLSYFLGRFAEYLWMAYFLALVADILRLESGKGVVQRKGARFYLISFAVFGPVGGRGWERGWGGEGLGGATFETPPQKDLTRSGRPSPDL
jgi:hypothetical protein